MPAQPEIFVRRLEPADAKSLLAAVSASRAELVYWLPWCKPDYALTDAEAWIAFASEACATGREFPLGVFDAASGQVIGGTGVNRIDRTERTGNIGYWVSTPWCGRGVARCAAREAAALGFGELRLSRLEILTLTHNIASQRVAESLGAVRECLARNRLVFHGEPHDALVYSLLPGDIRPAPRPAE